MILRSHKIHRFLGFYAAPSAVRYSSSWGAVHVYGFVRRMSAEHIGFSVAMEHN